MDNKGIDWGKIHLRIESVKTAIESGYTPGSEEKKKILKKRAELFAREPEDIKKDEYIEVVEFILALEHYGIESHYIREVYPLKDYTPIPCTPPFVFGLLNVRGQVISIVNIKKFFDMPEKGLSDLNKVIIVQGNKMEFGILADSIIGVRNIALSEIQAPMPTLTGMREEFLKGVTEERMVILDAGKLLSDKNIIVHEEA